MKKQPSIHPALRSILSLLLFPLVCLYYEVLLRLFAGPGIFRNPWYIILTAISFGLFCAAFTALWKESFRHLVCALLLLLSAVWFIIQTLLNRVYAMYFPAESISSGAGGVASQYSGMLLRTILLDIPVILLYLLPLFLYAGFSLYRKKHPGLETAPAASPVQTRLLGAGGLLLCAAVLQALSAGMEAGGKDSDVYGSAYTFDNATRTFGLLTSTRLDITYLVRGNDSTGTFDLGPGLSPDISPSAPSESFAAEAYVTESAAAESVAADSDPAESAVSDAETMSRELQPDVQTESASSASAFSLSASAIQNEGPSSEGSQNASGSSSTERPAVTKGSSGSPLVLAGGKKPSPAGGPLIITYKGAVSGSRSAAEPDAIAPETAGRSGGDESIDRIEDDEGTDIMEDGEGDDTAEDAVSTELPEDGRLEEETEMIEEEILPEPNIMDLDFGKLAEESAEPARSVSEYVNTLAPSMKNAWTGLFEGKNLILICAEAFNDSFVSKELTPTLWRMTHNGFYFSDFYQPAWGGSTSTGEFSMLFGLAPQNSSNTILQTQNSNNYFTMGNQLQRLGYHSWAFHNGTNTYYGRDKTHKNLGYDEWIAMGSGLEELSGGKYLNDEEMFDVTMDLYLDRQPFSVYYMSVSGHAPYSDPNDSKVISHIEKVKKVLGDHYGDYSQNTINYICYQMVLEDALTLMINRLEEAGIADDTVIAMTGDHYPYGLRGAEWGNSIDNIENLYGHEAATPWGLDKTGCIIWSGCLETTCKDMAVEISTPAYSLDMLPTLSNLFGLEYDSRLLIGRDVFSEQMPLVLWNNGSWITSRGRYNARTGTYESADSCQDAEVPASPAAAAAETARLHPELFPKEEQGMPLVLRLNGIRPDPEDIMPGSSDEETPDPLSAPDAGTGSETAADAALAGPADEAEYTEWVRTIVRNKLAFSKQVIDTNYYETLFGKDEDTGKDITG